MMDRVGQQLGNYRLVRLLGHGGFAEVYLGRHIYLGTQAAIKVLHTQLARDDLEGFRTEARTIAELVHSNIVRILDFGVDGHTPFLVMEYAPNGTLRGRYPKGGILPPKDIVSYVKQGAAALQYAHDRKLIHRDIKPENMLIGHDNRILLSDFGIALVAQSSLSQSTQEVAGTVAYMAPEQLQGKPRIASDQYALGVVIYEWLSGDRPFRGSFTEIASQHVLVPPPPLRGRVPTISPAVDEVVLRALAKDPHQRFLSVSAFATAFEEASRLQKPDIVKSSPSILPSSSSLSPTIVATPPSQSREIPSPLSQPTQLATPPSHSQSVASSLQPTQLATPPSPPLEARPLAPGTYSTAVRAIPQPKKGPNVGLLIGTAILLIALISGSFYVFTRSGSSNPGNVNSSQTRSNGNGTTTNTGGGGTTPTITAALVTDIGGLNDGGFNQMSYAGYEKARQQYSFPDKVIQSQVISDAEYTKNINAAAQQADMVIGIGFLMQNAIYTVAKQFPNKKFALIDGCATNPADKTGACQNLPNVAPLFFNEQQAGCLVGAIASQMEVDGKARIPKLLGHNTISAVGGLAIPPVVRYIAGYKYCAQKVDPSVTVVVGYSNDFTDPTKCKAVALNQINNSGADILFQVAGGCAIGVFDAANQQNIFSIGTDANQSKDSTGATRLSVITSAIERVDNAVFDIINDAQKGTFYSFVANPFKFDIAHDGVGFATPSSDVPQDAVQKAIDFANQIKAGTLVPPEQIP